MKWIYNPLLETYKIPQSLWGVGIGLFSFVIILGVLIYKKSKKFNVLLLSILFLLLLTVTSFTNWVYFSILSFVGMHFLLKFLDYHYVVEVNREVKDSMRASMVSLKSLIIRLLASCYLLLISFTLAKFSISTIFVITSSIILFLWILFTLFHKTVGSKGQFSK